MVLSIHFSRRFLVRHCVAVLWRMALYKRLFARAPFAAAIGQNQHFYDESVKFTVNLTE